VVWLYAGLLSSLEKQPEAFVPEIFDSHIGDCVATLHEYQAASSERPMGYKPHTQLDYVES
jgi:hypothetical protein